MSDNSIARVHFYSKQYLGLKDFEDEQHYHLTRLRQHQIGHHSWGIVRGLELALDTEKNMLVIRPGLAVDGYGRLLVLNYNYGISDADFENRGSTMLDVWLVYALQESDPPRPGSSDCVPSEAQAGASGNVSASQTAAFNRWQEQPVVRFTVPNPANPIEPRKPADVPEADWNFSPTRTPPDSPLEDWPVYLGRVKRTQDKPPSGPFTYEPILTGRPYAGLVGEVIGHPTGRARVQIGSSQLQDPDDIRFAVFIKDSEKKDSNPGPKRKNSSEDANQNNSTENARLEINKEGNMTLRGATTVEGDIRVSHGGVEFGAGKSYEPEQPWRFYRVAASQDKDGKLSPEQWRLVLEPGGEFSIGYFSSQDKQYKHCLQVHHLPSDDSDQGWTVSIEGDLHVKGRVYEKVLVPPELAIQAQTLVTQAFMAPLLGQVVTARPVAAPKPPSKLTKEETQQQIDLLAREVFETDRGLAKDLALALVKRDEKLNVAKEVILELARQDEKLNLAKEVILELAKEDPNLALAKGLVEAMTELIKPNNSAVLKKIKSALDL
ncbi:MAG TPA: hypothetical protein VFY26_09005 [Anaerolineales bacterium]|nr:hypothetical protein [Anaerolineales bacterium]